MAAAWKKQMLEGLTGIPDILKKSHASIVRLCTSGQITPERFSAAFLSSYATIEHELVKGGIPQDELRGGRVFPIFLASLCKMGGTGLRKKLFTSCGPAIVASLKHLAERKSDKDLVQQMLSQDALEVLNGWEKRVYESRPGSRSTDYSLCLMITFKVLDSSCGTHCDVLDHQLDLLQQQQNQTVQELKWAVAEFAAENEKRKEENKELRGRLEAVERVVKLRRTASPTRNRGLKI